MQLLILLHLLFFFQIVAIFLSNWKCINYLPSFYFECYWQLLPIYRKIYESMVIYDIMGHQISLLRGVIWNKFHAESITWLWLIWWLIIFSRYFGTKKRKFTLNSFQEFIDCTDFDKIIRTSFECQPNCEKSTFTVDYRKRIIFLEMYI